MAMVAPAAKAARGGARARRAGALGRHPRSTSARSRLHGPCHRAAVRSLAAPTGLQALHIVETGAETTVALSLVGGALAATLTGSLSPAAWVEAEAESRFKGEIAAVAGAGALAVLVAVEAAHALEPVAPFLLRVCGMLGIAGACIVALDNDEWVADLRDALEYEFSVGVLNDWRKSSTREQNVKGKKRTPRVRRRGEKIK